MTTNTALRAGPDWRREIREAGAPEAPGAQAAVKPVAPGMRWLLFAAAVLVFLAGFQLFVLTERTGTYFAWTIANPLAAAFLGASYWASLSIEALAGRQAAWANARIAVPAVFVFTVFTLVATLLHLDKFHLGGGVAAGTQIVTWAWLAIYVLVPLLMMIGLAVQARIPGEDPPRSAPLPGWVCGLLAVQAVGLFGFGMALFAAPAQTAPLWPWKLTPLLAQVTGAWLIGLGVAAAHALLERDARRFRPAAVGSVLLAVLQLVALARYPQLFEWRSPAGIVYLVFLATILLTGTVGLARSTRGRFSHTVTRRAGRLWIRIPNSWLPHLTWPPTGDVALGCAFPYELTFGEGSGMTSRLGLAPDTGTRSAERRGRRHRSRASRGPCGW